MRIWEQADKTGERVHYSWMLDGAKKWQSPGAGWKWVPGSRCRGVHSTTCISLVIAYAVRHGLRITSNGTHAAQGVQMSNAAAIANSGMPEATAANCRAATGC